MKFFHISDLHLGKRLHEVSLLPDQQAILAQILSLVDTHRPDGVLIAGDVYDKPVPPAEAVQLFDDFLAALMTRGVQTFVISGNHDSPERIAFGSRLMQPSGIHMSPVYGGETPPIVLHDEFGEVRVHLLPFVKPTHVRRFFPDAEIASYTDALRTAIDAMAIDPAVRNVLVTHQFVTGAARSESEEISVGGSDNVDAAVFDGFDYVALGHIHAPQNVGHETLRYCGTPLAYSFSEEGQQKSVTVVELREKGTVSIDTLPLTPAHALQTLRGDYLTLTSRAFYAARKLDDFYHIVLTDEEDIPDAVNRLRVIYPNILQLSYDNLRTRTSVEIDAAVAPQRDPAALFAEFYELQNNQPLSQAQQTLVARLIESIWEDEPCGR